jgi:hypothetical protein
MRPTSAARPKGAIGPESGKAPARPAISPLQNDRLRLSCRRGGRGRSSGEASLDALAGTGEAAMKLSSAVFAMFLTVIPVYALGESPHIPPKSQVLFSAGPLLSIDGNVIVINADGEKSIYVDEWTTLCIGTKRVESIEAFRPLISKNVAIETGDTEPVNGKGQYYAFLVRDGEIQAGGARMTGNMGSYLTGPFKQPTCE